MSPRTRTKIKASANTLDDNPQWYRDAVIYELHVRAFYDANGDGIGDFEGLTQKLDYLQDLGITAIWLLPFFPSPLRDDGYDIANYTDVHPAYGTMRDFRRFLDAAHERGLRVIIELAINHTSSDHPWFQRARHAPAGSRDRNFYVWSDSPERYQEARVIFQDFESSNWSWDPVAGAYYWHRFYSHQPDLNFDSPQVRKAVLGVVDFWMELGVDGMRLDAVPYLYQREGTNCENLPETHAFLKQLRAHVDRRYANRMLLAEANQWPEDAAAYFGDGDECHMNFHFPLMPRMFMGLQLENGHPIADILEQTPEIPESCQWAIFLRNHDELTLEMVTDEDRDYMYRTYAEDPQARINLGIRRRLAPLLQVRRKIELMNGVLFSLLGTPVIYYGDEIGQGDNIYLGDRNGVRTPMQWSGDRNAGFSRANPQKLYLPVIIDPEYHFEALNVEVQQNNPTSLLWWMKRIIAMRKRYPAFGRGTMEFLRPDNPRVLCFLRSYQGETVLVVANLSRFTEYVELDLSRHEGMVPVEIFGQNEFPRIGELPYLLTLGPHAFYWFALTEPKGLPRRPPAAATAIEVRGSWPEFLSTKAGAAIEQSVLDYIQIRRWFRGKAKKVRGASILDTIAVPQSANGAVIALVEVQYGQDLPEIYVVPLAFATDEAAAAIAREHPEAVIGELRVRKSRRRSAPQEAGMLYDPTVTQDFARALYRVFGRRNPLQGQSGALHAARQAKGSRLTKQEIDKLVPRLGSAEQSNTCFMMGDRAVVKIYRHLEEGQNPDLEIVEYLTRHGFTHAPRFTGALEYSGSRRRKAGVAIVQDFVPNQGDAWEHTLSALDRYFEYVPAHLAEHPMEELPKGPLVEALDKPISELGAEVMGPYMSFVRLLGQRTAELHLSLAQSQEKAFVAERFSKLDQRSFYESARSRLSGALQLLKRNESKLDDETRELARKVLAKEQEARARLKAMLNVRIASKRIRCHGDFHLGQILYTGKDFVIIDFEGEPALPLAVRRLKRTPLYDVCGMLRSFDYAVNWVLRHGHTRPEDIPVLEPWGAAWKRWASAQFVTSYLEAAGDAVFVPKDQKELDTLLYFSLLDKCAYEIGYEFNNRPQWLQVPLRGMVELLAAVQGGS